MAAARATPRESRAFEINSQLWPEYDGYIRLEGGEIRLIDIKGGNPPICRIRHVSLDEKPHYYGLSYYWGAPVESGNLKAVELNGSRVLIRPNIYALIWHLITRYQEVTVWLDVLCINQRDSEERSQQVSMMGNIFSFAAGVYVWLGEGDADSDYAFDYINHKERAFNYEILSLCLEQLTLRPYWTRMWVIQEIALAKSVQILCGTKWSSWDDFSQSTKRHIAQRSPHFWQVMDVRNPERPARQLFQLMEDFKSTRCVDARDKAYGVRALAEDGHELDIDYRESVENLFFRIVSLYQDTAYLNSDSLADFHHNSESLLACLSLSREKLLKALDGSKLDRLYYLTEFYGRVVAVHGIEDTRDPDLEGFQAKLEVKGKDFYKLSVLYGGTDVMPGDFIYCLNRFMPLKPVLIVFRPGDSGIIDVVLDPTRMGVLEVFWNLDFQLLRRCLVNGMVICRVAGPGLPDRLRRYGRKVNDSDTQIFHINRLVWYLVLAHTTQERIDALGIDAEQRVQRPKQPFNQHRVLGMPIELDRQSNKLLAMLTLEIHITRNPWFMRAWVFQEIVLPTDVEIICGGQSMSLECFEWFCECYLEVISDTPVSKQASPMVVTRRFISDCADRRLPIDHLERLLSFRRQTTTDEPHDIIFSLLGLFPESLTTLIRPDYAISIKNTFTTAARVIIQGSGDLRILCAVECPKHENQDGFPSWVPDWRAPVESCEKVLADRNPRSDWCATQGSPLLIDTSGNKDELGVWGILQATVTAIHEPNAEFNIPDLHGRGKIYQPTNQPMVAALKQARTLDLMEFWDDVVVGSKSRLVLAQFLGLPEAIPSLTKDSCHEEDTDEIRSAYHWIQETADSRVLIDTDTGHIGFAPISSRIGDKVYLLLGLHVPVVLRPHGQKFKFVGCCYIHGIMYGEGLHHDFPLNSQYYPGSNPLDEVWLLKSKYERQHRKPQMLWTRPKSAVRGRKNQGSSKHAEWEFCSTSHNQCPSPVSPSTESLWLIGDGADSLPIITQKIVLV